MAGLIGEGGLVILSGTCNAASPAILADFTCNNGRIRQGPDGMPPNGYSVANRDTSSGLILWVQIQGLNTTNSNSGTGTRAYPIYPGETQPFQMSFDSNDLLQVRAWLTDLTNTPGVANAVVSGGVFIRRE